MKGICHMKSLLFLVPGLIFSAHAMESDSGDRAPLNPGASSPFLHHERFVRESELRTENARLAGELDRAVRAKQDLALRLFQVRMRLLEKTKKVSDLEKHSDASLERLEQKAHEMAQAEDEHGRLVLEWATNCRVERKEFEQECERLRKQRWVSGFGGFVAGVIGRSLIKK